jgi:SAM-dependent methyltransferase
MAVDAFERERLNSERQRLIAKAIGETRLAAEESFPVSPKISEQDLMHDTSQTYAYFRCGAGALNAINSMIAISDHPDTQNILDFGCGHGRVMRWLRAAFPNAKISGTDVSSDGLAFCAEEFGANTIPSGVDFEQLPQFPRQDLIWAGSVFTHLSERDADFLLSNFMDWLAPWGIAVLSTHGRTAIRHLIDNRSEYIDGDKLYLLRDYFEAEYSFKPYDGTPGYGVSFAKPDWYIRRVFSRNDIVLLSYSERAWEFHHDIVAIQKIPS